MAVASTANEIAYVLTDNDDKWNIQAAPTGYVHVQALGAALAAARALDERSAARFRCGRRIGSRLAFVRGPHGSRNHLGCHGIR